MVSLSSIENKLNKIKKAIGNNGIEKIYVWLKEDEPIKVDLIYDKKVDRLYCYNMEEYESILEEYKDIEIIEVLGIKKPEPGDIAMVN